MIGQSNNNSDNELLKWIRYSLYFILVILFIVLGFYMTFFILLKLNPEINFGNIGSLGDSVSGFLTPIISAIAVATTFLAFLVQYEANQNQRNDIKKERFETKFYELLKLHKENVNEIEIGKGIKGREAFVRIFDEIIMSAFILKNLKEENRLEKVSTNELFRIIFDVVFYGLPIEMSEEVRNEEAIEEKNIEWLIKNYRYKVRQNKLDRMSDPSVEMVFFNQKSEVLWLVPSQIPFSGYHTQLGHYYRTIYHIVTFVVSNKDLSWTEKYDYIKILRSQLSNYEQILLFINACWESHEVWWNDKSKKDNNGNPYRYLLDYALVKNIPFSVMEEIGVDIAEVYKEKLGDGPYFIDDKEVDIDQKMEWLFEWY